MNLSAWLVLAVIFVFFMGTVSFIGIVTYSIWSKFIDSTIRARIILVIMILITVAAVLQMVFYDQLSAFMFPNLH